MPHSKKKKEKPKENPIPDLNPKKDDKHPDYKLTPFDLGKDSPLKYIFFAVFINIATGFY